MKETHINKFNNVYSSANYYYGLELRHEFTDYFADKNIKGFVALDLGAGEGRYALYLANRGCTVAAIDRSNVGIKKMIEKSEELKLGIQALAVDIADFKFAANYYDIVVAATILDHLPDKLRFETASRIKHALKPGGILYVNVFTVLDPGYASHPGTTGGGRQNVSDTADCIEHYFNPGELRHLFGGLEILHEYEGIEPDISHGTPHHHGWACLLAKKLI